MILSSVERIVKKMEDRNESISFAESCTGGRIAALFTSLAGVSSVFNGSFVTYSNEIKHLWLGVENSILNKFGAVSKECVEQMLAGIIEKSASNHAIAVSGIAGPSGGTEKKPIGTVFIGISINGQIIVERYHFMGDREEIQSASAEEAIKLFEKNFIILSKTLDK